MKRLAILGASGHGKVIADTAQACGWQKIVFFDDAWPNKSSNGHWDIVGDSQVLLEQSKCFDGVIVAIGHNATRLIKLQELMAKSLYIVSLIHPSAVVSKYSHIGYGSAVLAGSIIQADASVGVGCIINSGATIDHDCLLGDAVHISPGVHLAGGVQIGQESWIGIGACVKQSVQVGCQCVVGAGAVVIGPVADGITVVGVPAKIISLDNKC